MLSWLCGFELWLLSTSCWEHLIEEISLLPGGLGLTRNRKQPGSWYIIYSMALKIQLSFTGLPAKSATTKAGDQVFNTWAFGEHWRSDQKTAVLYFVTSSYQIPSVIVMWHFFVTGLLHLTWWVLVPSVLFQRTGFHSFFLIILLYTCASFPPPTHQLMDPQVTALSWLLWQRSTEHSHADDFPALCFLSLNSELLCWLRW